MRTRACSPADALAGTGDEAGTSFPFSPRWHSVTNLDYRWPLKGGIEGFAGASATWNSETYAGTGELDPLRIDAYTLLDVRAGMDFSGGRYRVWAWGRNLTNRYYWTNVFAIGNAIARFVGQPATWGIGLSAHF